MPEREHAQGSVGDCGGWCRDETLNASRGQIIGLATFFGVGIGLGTFHTLAVSAPGILRFELYQPTPTVGDGVFFDNLISSPVPEPSSLLLFRLAALLANAYRIRGIKLPFVGGPRHPATIARTLRNFAERNGA
jgi:hypothetical protein